MQLGLLPSRDRVFPEVLALPHDYAAWHGQMSAAKRSGVVDWHRAVAPLATFGPGTFEIDDPQNLTATGFGMPMRYDVHADWELGSPVARPMRQSHAAG